MAASRLGSLAVLLCLAAVCLPAATGDAAVRSSRHARTRHARRHRARRHHRRRHRHHAGHALRRSGSLASACSGADALPSAGDLELVRAAIACLVNRERTTRGEQPLALSVQLAAAAQQHTSSMAARGYFGHVGPGGDTPLTRIRASGYMRGGRLGWAIGENIAWGTGSLGTPRSIVSAWMASPEHRANILDPRFRDTGIGVGASTPAGAGGIYTQDFGAVYG